jgi:hypothetical protein
MYKPRLAVKWYIVPLSLDYLSVQQSIDDLALSDHVQFILLSPLWCQIALRKVRRICGLPTPNLQVCPFLALEVFECTFAFGDLRGGL